MVFALVLAVVIAEGTHKVKLARTVETDLFSEGQVELNKGNYYSSIEIFETFLKRDPNHVPALTFKMQAEIRSDRWKDAEATAERIMTLQPTDINKKQLAEVYVHNGKEAKAKQVLNLEQARPSPQPSPKK